MGSSKRQHHAPDRSKRSDPGSHQTYSNTRLSRRIQEARETLAAGEGGAAGSGGFAAVLLPWGARLRLEYQA